MTRWVRLGSVVQSSSAPVVVDAEAEYRNVGILNKGRGLFEKPVLLGGETKYPTLFQISTGDLIYSKLFAWEGAVTVVSPEYGGAHVSSEFPTFTSDISVVDPGFLSQVVAWEGFIDQIRSSASGLGQRRQRVNPSNFLNARVPLPPLAEQRRIAAHLERAGRQTTAVSSREAPMLRRGRLLKDRIVDNVSTQVVELGDILRPRETVSVQGANSYRMTGVYSFGHGLIDRGTLEGSETKYKDLRQLHEGDVVYSKLGAFENAVAVVDHNFADTFVSPEFPVFEVTADMDRDFLRACLTTSTFAERLTQVSSGVGARQRRVSPAKFLQFQIPLPPVHIQRQLGDSLRTLRRLEALAARSAALSSALLPAARNEIFSAMR